MKTKLLVVRRTKDLLQCAEALRDLMSLRDRGLDADVLRADFSGPDELLGWDEVHLIAEANARAALAGLDVTDAELDRLIAAEDAAAERAANSQFGVGA